MCSDREADEVAFSFFRYGYNAFVLRYAVMENKTWPNPLQDYEDAMKLIRDNAEEWRIYPDKIAVCGFSAGGHLAGAAATMSENRPNAAILGYPVLNQASTMDWNTSAPDIISHIDEQTCPCFLFHSRKDELVLVSNTIEAMAALDKAGVTFESHVYAYGPHGFSTANQMMRTPDSGMICRRIPNWVDDAFGFLEDIFGTFGNGCMNKPAVGHYAFPEKGGEISADCSIGYLMSLPETSPIIAPIMQGMAAAQSQNENHDMMISQEAFGRFSLRTILGFGGTAQEQIDAIDQALRALMK